MPHLVHRPVHPRSILLSLPLLALGCAVPPSAPPDEVQATLTVATVPADLACLRITIAGPGRTVVREIPVMAGAMINEAFSGLPLGTVTFTGEGFSGDCTAVTRSTIPGWASDPETVAIVLGRQATVALTLNRNGRARVTVGFNDEPTCTAAGGACITNAECCSRACTHGVCEVGDGGGGD